MDYTFPPKSLAKLENLAQNIQLLVVNYCNVHRDYRFSVSKAIPPKEAQGKRTGKFQLGKKVLSLIIYKKKVQKLLLSLNLLSLLLSGLHI